MWSTPWLAPLGKVTEATVFPGRKGMLVAKTFVPICCEAPPALLRYGIDATVPLPNEGLPAVQSVTTATAKPRSPNASRSAYR
jgi:hypothetical protein